MHTFHDDTQQILRISDPGELQEESPGTKMSLTSLTTMAARAPFEKVEDRHLDEQTA